MMKYQHIAEIKWNLGYDELRLKVPSAIKDKQDVKDIDK